MRSLASAISLFVTTMSSTRSSFLLLFFSLFTTAFSASWSFGGSSQQPLASKDDIKVPVVLGVMSRCPDAILCENLFDQVLKKVADKVDMELAYIAKCAHLHTLEQVLNR